MNPTWNMAQKSIEDAITYFPKNIIGKYNTDLLAESYFQLAMLYYNYPYEYTGNTLFYEYNGNNNLNCSIYSTEKAVTLTKNKYRQSDFYFFYFNFMMRLVIIHKQIPHISSLPN